MDDPYEIATINVTIDGWIYVTDAVTGEVLDIAGMADGQRDASSDVFHVTDMDGAEWVVGKLREAEAELVAAAAGMEAEIEAVTRAWKSRARRAACKAAWLRDRFEQEVLNVTLPMISGRAKSIKVGSGLAGTRAVSGKAEIDDMDRLVMHAVGAMPEAVKVGSFQLPRDAKVVPIAVNVLAKLRDAGCEVSLKVNPSDAVKMVRDGTPPPGVTYTEPTEKAYLTSGIKVPPAAKKLAGSGDAEVEEP